MIHRLRELLHSEYGKVLSGNKKVKKSSLSRVAGKILIFFFVIMLLFTILSRATESFAVARVVVENPRRDVLTHTLMGTGQIAMAEEETMNILPGYHIDKIYVSTGEAVSTKTILYQYRIEDLQNKYNSINNEIKKIHNQIEIAQLNTISVDQFAAPASLLSLQQAKDNLSVARAKLSEEQADYNSFLQENKKQPQGEQKAEYNSELEGKLEAVKVAKETVRIAEQTVETSNLQYNISKQGDANKIKSTNKSNKITELTIQGYRLDLLEKEKELKNVNTLLNKSGKVTSPFKGIISHISLEEGKTTMGDELIKIGVGDYVLKGAFVSEQEVNVEIGSKVKITIAGGPEDKISSKVSKLRINENGSPELVAVLPSGKYRMGEGAQFKIMTQSERYDQCIPIQALHESGKDEYYVLVTREHEDILGKILIATRVKVDIIGKSDSMVAVKEGALSRKDDVIIDSSKNINDGDKVRIS